MAESDTQQDQEVKIPVLPYFFAGIITFVLGLFPSCVIVYFYYPFAKMIGLDSLFGLTAISILGIENFWIWFFMPGTFILAYALWIYFTGWVASLWVLFWNKRSPPVTGLFQRRFGENDVADDRLKYYHYRGYIIKWPLWLAMKSPFPWSKYWILKKVGHNKLDKKVVYLEAFPSLEFSDLKKNATFQPGSMASSHVVDSLYGNLTLKDVIIEEDATMHCNSVLAPGAHIKENSVLMPAAFAIKNWESKDGVDFYNGAPARSIEGEYKGAFNRLSEGAKALYQKEGYVLGEEIQKT